MTAVAVLFGDVEALLCTALPPLLAAHGRTVPVVAHVPTPRPGEFLRVMLTGGDRRNLVQDGPLVTVEAWAATETAASSLARITRALLETLPGQIIGGILVYRARDFSVPVNLPDPTSGQTRYTFTGPISVRGTDLV